MRIPLARSITGMALLVAVTAAGCGQEPPPTPAPSAPSPAPVATPAATTPAPSPEAEALAGKLCDALHTIVAKRRSECCGTHPTSLALQCTKVLSESITRGAITVDASQLDRCAEAMALALEGCDWVTPLMPTLPEPCKSLLHGRLKAGERCGSGLECEDGLTCRGVTPTGQGICAPPTPAGERCANPADSLAAMAHAREDPRHAPCDGVCIKGKCLPYAKAGGACGPGAPCAPGLLCVDGTCQDVPLPTSGQPCAGESGCAAGMYCDGGTCRPLKAEGEPCNLPFECRGLTCPKEPGAATGTCGPPCGSATVSIAPTAGGA